MTPDEQVEAAVRDAFAARAARAGRVDASAALVAVRGQAAPPAPRGRSTLRRWWWAVAAALVAVGVVGVLVERRDEGPVVTPPSTSTTTVPGRPAPLVPTAWPSDVEPRPYLASSGSGGIVDVGVLTRDGRLAALVTLQDGSAEPVLGERRTEISGRPASWRNVTGADELLVEATAGRQLLVQPRGASVEDVEAGLGRFQLGAGGITGPGGDGWAYRPDTSGLLERLLTGWTGRDDWFYVEPTVSGARRHLSYWVGGSAQAIAIVRSVAEIWDGASTSLRVGDRPATLVSLEGDASPPGTLVWAVDDHHIGVLQGAESVDEAVAVGRSVRPLADDPRNASLADPATMAKTHPKLGRGTLAGLAWSVIAVPAGEYIVDRPAEEGSVEVLLSAPPGRSLFAGVVGPKPSLVRSAGVILCTSWVPLGVSDAVITVGGRARPSVTVDVPGVQRRLVVSASDSADDPWIAPDGVSYDGAVVSGVNPDGSPYSRSITDPP